MLSLGVLKQSIVTDGEREDVNTPGVMFGTRLNCFYDVLHTIKGVIDIQDEKYSDFVKLRTFLRFVVRSNFR